MGLVDRWDCRNERTLEAHNDRDEVVAPGVVAISSVPALVTIAVSSIGVAIVLVVQGGPWSYAAAALTVLSGGALCASLARDVQRDAGDRQRRHERSARSEAPN